MDLLYKEIKRIKKKLGNNIVIPAHHYQMDEIVQLADFLGDSYKLAVDCSKTESKYILFCGVHFMAEGAAILSSDNQKVIAPDIQAGCPMADMITTKDAEKAYEAMSSQCQREIIPVVYMNSSASMKAFCGARKGTVCTSSNSMKIVKNFLDDGKSVFFSPDYNLGINTANQLNVPHKDIVTVTRDGSLQGGDPQSAKLFLWDGYCHVHKCFTVEDMTQLRSQYPDIRIIVHPECEEPVVNGADYSGSTSMIYNTVRDAAPGTVWGIGTEHNFVSRIAAEFKDKTVIPLQKSLCGDMNRTTLEKLARVMGAVEKHFKGEGELVNEVTVSKAHQQDAGKALKRMIAIVEAAK